MEAYCDCCGEKRPCVRLIESEVFGDTAACHKCRYEKDDDCDECQEAKETADAHEAQESR
jgi:hypothetical protein